MFHLAVEAVVASVYLLCRAVWPLCDVIPPKTCVLPTNEGQVFILAVIAAGARVGRKRQWNDFIPKLCYYMKFINCVLFFRLDVRLFIGYMVLVVISALVTGSGPLSGSQQSKSRATPSKLLNLSGKELEEYFNGDDTSASSGLLVVFHASWSPSSQALVQVLDKMSISEEYAGKTRFAAVEVSHDPATARKYEFDHSVTSTELPVLMLFPTGCNGTPSIRQHLGPKALAVQEGYIQDHFLVPSREKSN